MFELTVIRRQIADLLAATAIDSRVLRCLSFDGKFVPKESSLWDYKKSIGAEPVDVAGIVKDIAAFHNAYGGYLVFGVEEVQGSSELKACGVSPGMIRQESLRNQISKWLTSPIDVSYSEFEFELPDGRATMALLHIPKRLASFPPISFLVNGPDKSGGKQTFRQGTIAVRVGDESRVALSIEDYRFVWGPRIPEFIAADQSHGIDAVLRISEPLSNNLPDRNLICPKFLGRGEIIKSLWQWLADPFAYARVLAGDGGKGKTSIAYQFATEFSVAKPAGFESVIWLSAKQKQFVALENAYRKLPQQDYSSLDTLLKSICIGSGLQLSEIDDLDTQSLKISAVNALKVIPALVIVDDVDSVDPNEQRRILEAAMHLGQSKSRFLLTTRANLSYSSDMCINVPGFSANEFEEFVTSISTRLVIPKPKDADLSALHSATDGSPLLAESVLRLVKRGANIRAAISEWKGQAGRDARSAALQKEVGQLSTDAKKVLLAMAILEDCSRVEVGALTAFESVKIADCIEELHSLFLIDAPPVTADQPRCSVPAITRSLVLERPQDFAVDHKRMTNEARELRSPAKQRTGNAWRIGAAIQQASAQIREGAPEEATKTVRAALRYEKDHKDLLSMLGRALIACGPGRIGEARDVFRGAYRSGSRRAEMFKDWFIAELSSGDPSGAIEVCAYNEAALGASDDWIARRATARAALADIRARQGDLESALRIYGEASDDLQAAIQSSRGPIRADRVFVAAEVHDRALKCAERLDIEPSAARFDVAWKAIKRGDYRHTLFSALFESISEVLASSERIVGGSHTDQRVSNFLSRALEVVRQRPSRNDDEEEIRKKFFRTLEELDTQYLSARR